jgi:hypothetical protein
LANGAPEASTVDSNQKASGPTAIAQRFRELPVDAFEQFQRLQIEDADRDESLNRFSQRAKSEFQLKSDQQQADAGQPGSRDAEKADAPQPQDQSESAPAAPLKNADELRKFSETQDAIEKSNNKVLDKENGDAAKGNIGNVSRLDKTQQTQRLIRLYLLIVPENQPADTQTLQIEE